MGTTYSAGRMFIQPLNLDPGAPRVSTAPTFETTHPYRHSQSLVLRLAGSRGLAAGVWRDNPGDIEDEATVTRHLLEALRSAEGTPGFLAASREAWGSQGGNLRDSGDPAWLSGGDGDFRAPPAPVVTSDRDDVPPDSGCPAYIPASPIAPRGPLAMAV